MKSKLLGFENAELSRQEAKKVVGGQVEICTDGNNAQCFYSFNDAMRACGADDTCTGVTIRNS